MKRYDWYIALAVFCLFAGILLPVPDFYSGALLGACVTSGFIGVNEAVHRVNEL